jgi:hypothetical protein
MDSAMIGKIEKAMRYAKEPSRFVFSEFKVTVNGDHGEHAVAYDKGRWDCDCQFFASRGLCSHTMALERLLSGMIPPEWPGEA